MLITDEDIRYAESILLENDQTFDDERRDFIKNMQTIDLQAVPGSGKTTALLAKLIIIETKLPLKDGGGILVLSHTNAAVDEIKYRIQSYCPKLFAYPHFVGTIQSFVDTFLAIPYYTNVFKRKINRLDNEIYEEIASRKYFKIKSINYSAFKWLERKSDSKQYFLNLRFDKDFNLIEGLNGRVCLQNKNEKSSQSYSCLTAVKMDILSSGYLHFDDAYIIAEDAILSTGVLNIIQKRFPFIFVDEMQDMGKHQYELLEKLFHQNNSDIVLQRIGDINQAIYNLGKIESSCSWEYRDEPLSLSNSHRLSPNNANVVKNFASNTDYKIDGKNTSTNLKPHILCFNDVTVQEVIPFYSRLVEQYYTEGKLPNFSKKPIKAIAWNMDWKDDEVSRNDVTKLRLEDYHRLFNRNSTRVKIDYHCLKEYLIYHNRDKKTLESIRKNILNALNKILRLEGVKYKDERNKNIGFYTKRKLLNYLKEKHFDFYELLKLKLYRWSIKIVEGDVNNTWEDIKIFIPDFLSIFNSLPNHCKDFIDNDIGNNQLKPENENAEQLNYYDENSFRVEIASVHSVKGQTHCATLYLESYYKSKYESERLKSIFLQKGELKKSNINNATMKMIYVGLSRPMDLLCVAIHESRLSDMREKLENEWEIIDIFGLID